MTQESQAASAAPLWVGGRLDWARKPDNARQALLTGLKVEGITEEARRRTRSYIVGEVIKKYRRQQ